MGWKWINNWFKFKKRVKKIKKIEVSQEIRDIVKALGGINNIVAFNNCATKLRYDIINDLKVDKDKLYELGAQDILLFGPKHIQIKFGDRAEELNMEILRVKEALKLEESQTVEIEKDKNLLQDQVKTEESENKKQVEQTNIIYSPCSGEWKSLTEVPDKVFSSKMLGTGYAICNNNKSKITIYAPVSGTIETNYASKHAFGIKANDIEVLLHIGIGTSTLNGIGFESFVKQNDKVERGQKIVEVDLKKLREANVPCTDVILVLTDQKHKDSQLKILCSKVISQENIPWLEIIE